MTENKELREKMEFHLKQNESFIKSLFNSIEDDLKMLDEVLNEIDSLYAQVKNKNFHSGNLMQLQSLLENKISRMITTTDSVQSASAAILENSKQGIGSLYGKIGNWPNDLLKNGVPISLILQGGRNQAAHWREFKFNDVKDPNDRGKIREAFKKMYDLVDDDKKELYDITKDDPTVENPTNRNRANQVLKFLNWYNYSQYEKDMLSFAK